MLSPANYELLKSFSDREEKPINRYEERTSMLVEADYLTVTKHIGDPMPNGKIRLRTHFTAHISQAGLDALLEFEKCRQQEAKAERQQRFDNKVSVASVLVPLITFILGLIIEHYAGIVGLLLSMFH